MKIGSTKFAIVGNAKMFRVPAPMWRDSDFPFSDDEEVLMKIEKKKLVIEKI
jgi:hypothetical protein